MAGIPQPYHPESFENRILAFEQEAQAKYSCAVRNMKAADLPGWLKSLLNNKIIPQLEPIGFEASFSRTIFQLAAPAWQSTGPLTDKELWFHPVLMRDIEDFRKGLIRSKQRFERFAYGSGGNLHELRTVANNQMHPSKVLSLLDDVSLSWVILPRVYDHLEKQHSWSLPGYIRYFNNEADSDFREILARIIIEFIGNYTAKFMDRIHPKAQVCEALFFGYEAMFWRNLRKPPSGSEDLKTFMHFFHWADRFQKRFLYNHSEASAEINKMEKEKLKAFPEWNAFGLAPVRCDDTSMFVVALRHGRLGIDDLIKIFGIGSALLKNMTDGLLPYLFVPRALSGLFRKIQNDFYSESRRTQSFVRAFLEELEDSYNFKHRKSLDTETGITEQLRFVKPRVICMINSLLGSL